MSFQGKVAIVTGAAQGIGRRIAEVLAGEGSSVVICDINESLAATAAKEIEQTHKVKARSVRADVLKRDDIRALVSFAIRNFGQIDFVVNNAGVMLQTKIHEISQEEWDYVLGINLRGPFFLSQEVSPILKEQRRGCILNMASIAGKIGGISSGAHYAVSKAGVICLTKVFARELAPFGVRVNALAPGPVDTALLHIFSEEQKAGFVQNTLLGRLADTDDIALAAKYLLSEDAKHITGHVLDINGGLLMD